MRGERDSETGRRQAAYLYPVQAVVGDEDEGHVHRHAVDRLELARRRAAAAELLVPRRAKEEKGGRRRVSSCLGTTFVRHLFVKLAGAGSTCLTKAPVCLS